MLRAQPVQIVRDEERAIQILSETLGRIHGHVTPRREASGLQLYMACPICLMTRGKQELIDRKMGENVTQSPSRISGYLFCKLRSPPPGDWRRAA